MVDLAGQLDEAGVDAVFARFPGEIEGVDRDAVTAQAGAGFVGHEPKGLGSGGVDHLVNVDAHLIGHDLHLVDQADVDAAVDVFEQLGHLGGAGAADGHHGLDGVPVQRDA